jgi:hypothetical protein
MKRDLPSLDPTAFRTICEYAINEAILPEDVLRLAAGVKPREPFLVDPAELVRTFHLGKRFVSILRALYLGNPKKFDSAAPLLHGTVRTYFGTTREQVEKTGTSNSAAAIPDTPWFVSVNNSQARRSQIVADLMNLMEFSYEYASMISGLCVSHTARLPGGYQRALARLTKQTPRS